LSTAPRLFRGLHRLAPYLLRLVEIQPLRLAVVELQVRVDLLAQRLGRALELGRQPDDRVGRAHDEPLHAGRAFVAGRQLVLGIGRARSGERD
jgi:hypothetical protein